MPRIPATLFDRMTAMLTRAGIATTAAAVTGSAAGYFQWVSSDTPLGKATQRLEKHMNWLGLSAFLDQVSHQTQGPQRLVLGLIESRHETESHFWLREPGSGKSVPPLTADMPCLAGTLTMAVKWQNFTFGLNPPEITMTVKSTDGTVIFETSSISGVDLLEGTPLTFDAKTAGIGALGISKGQWVNISLPPLDQLAQLPLDHYTIKMKAGPINLQKVFSAPMPSRGLNADVDTSDVQPSPMATLAERISYCARHPHNPNNPYLLSSQKSTPLLAELEATDVSPTTFSLIADEAVYGLTPFGGVKALELKNPRAVQYSGPPDALDATALLSRVGLTNYAKDVSIVDTEAGLQIAKGLAVSEQPPSLKTFQALLPSAAGCRLNYEGKGDESITEVGGHNAVIRGLYFWAEKVIRTGSAPTATSPYVVESVPREQVPRL